MIQIGDASANIFVGIYYYIFDTIDFSLWVMFFAYIICAILLHFRMPESPKYLFAKQ